MKKEDLFDLIGELDDEQIENAGKSWESTHKANMRLFLVYAACISFICLSMFIRPIGKGAPVKENTEINLVEFNGQLYQIVFPSSGPEGSSTLYNLPAFITEKMVGASLGQGTMWNTGKESGEIFAYTPSYQTVTDPLIYLIRSVEFNGYGPYQYLIYYCGTNADKETAADRLEMYGITAANDVERMICEDEMKTERVTDPTLIEWFVDSLIQSVPITTNSWDQNASFSIRIIAQNGIHFWMEFDVKNSLVKWSDTYYPMPAEMAEKFAVYNDKWLEWEWLQQSYKWNNNNYHVVELGGFYNDLYQLPEVVTEDLCGKYVGTISGLGELYEYLPYHEIADQLIYIVKRSDSYCYLRLDSLSYNIPEKSIGELLAYYGINSPEDIVKIQYGDGYTFGYGGDLKMEEAEKDQFAKDLLEASEIGFGGSFHGWKEDSMLGLELITKDSIVVFLLYDTESRVVKLTNIEYQLP